MWSITRRSVLVVCVVAITACAASTPSATVASFDHLIEAGKYDQAIALLSTSARGMFPDDKMKAQMASESAKMRAGGGIKSMAFVNEAVNGDTATLTATTTLANGKTSSENFSLLREAGEWRITIGK